MFFICYISSILTKLVLIHFLEKMQTLTIVKQKPCINQLILWFLKTFRRLSFQQKIIAIIIIYSDLFLFSIFARILKHMTMFLA
ncbi:hypothetical protein MARPO_0010s0029 [Marchantia polymorpha]|uniref:Uncharacterized protein n=1 Tax=Marchantia polymorpha TaxID=3197 RepID=A0A2R6XKF4_MARPO|nr:hypothetical protein MARPO_0010s0029 [Marchantia polymorpha]|eukprot:PTQ46617.1 hypothetical protein MARPO_0010s0029 [Marchantia polymorpha]